jgi:hypothetical protein
VYFRKTKQSGALNILNVWLDPGPSALLMVCELCHGSEVRGSMSAPASVFGLSGFDEVPSSGLWSGTMPQSLIDWLQPKLPADSTPLWLSFGTHPDPSGSEPPSPRIGRTQSRPTGFLPALSWELNLVPKIQRPVLRMQGMSVRPLTQRHTLHVAVCCSFSVAKQMQSPAETLLRIFNQIPSLPSQALTLHLFADQEVQGALVPVQQMLRETAQVRIYNPRDAARYGDAQRRDSIPEASDLQNPWLLWMRNTLSETGVDAVQFVTHGYMSRGHGALAFAESPLHNEDRQWARFVGTREISMFLDQLGAWSAVLTSSPDNFSVAGLRILQDELTEYVAGPVMLYNMADDPANNDLRTAYQYVFGVGTEQPEEMPAVSLYTHPDWGQPAGTAEEIPTQHLMEEFTLAGRLGDAFASPEEVPGWLAAGQRSLERSINKISVSGEETEANRATQQGRQDALRLTADLFAKFAGLTGKNQKEPL